MSIHGKKKLFANALMLVFFVLFAIQLPAAVQDEPTRVDYLGDPLPTGALLRLGTKRFSPGSTYFNSLSADDRVIVSLGEGMYGWDAATGRPLWRIKATADNFPAAFMTSAAAYGFRPMISLPRTNRLLLPIGKGKLGILDFAAGNTTPLIDLKNSEQTCAIDVNPNESLIAVGTPSKLIVCDFAGNVKFEIDNKPQGSIEKLTSQQDRLAFGGEFSFPTFSPDGQLLVLVNSEKPTSLQVLNSISGEFVKTIESRARIVRVAFSPDGQRLATTERDISARNYKVENGELVWERIFSPDGPDERYTTDLQFSPDDNVLAVGTAIGEDNRIHLLNPQSGETVGTLEGHTWKPWCLSFQRDGKKLFSTGWDGVVRVWDVEKREQIRIENSERASSVCTLTQDGRKLAYCDDTGNLHVVDSKTGAKLKSRQLPGTKFSQLAFSADGTKLAAGGSSLAQISVAVWNLDEEEPEHLWSWGKGRDVHSSVDSLSFTPDGRRLAVAVFRQSTCFVFDLPTNTKLHEFKHPQIYGLGLHPDGEKLVTAGWDSKVRLWNLTNGELDLEQAITLDNNRDARMYGVKFSPNRQRIATLQMSSALIVLDDTLQKLREIELPNRPVYDCFNFSKNGLWIAVGHMGGDVNLVDVSTGELIWNQKCHDNHVYNIEFGPDDRTMLTGGEDGVNYLWDLAGTKLPAPDAIEELAADLFREDAKKGFEAFQSLAQAAEIALPAIALRVDKLLQSFQSLDQPAVTASVELMLTMGESPKKQVDPIIQSILDSGLGHAMEVERVLSDKMVDVQEDDLKIRPLVDLRAGIEGRLHGLSRALHLIAILDLPEAGTKLDAWFSQSSNVKAKKAIFIAKKYREQWHRRLNGD